MAWQLSNLVLSRLQWALVLNINTLVLSINIERNYIILNSEETYGCKIHAQASHDVPELKLTRL